MYIDTQPEISRFLERTKSVSLLKERKGDKEIAPVSK